MRLFSKKLLFAITIAAAILVYPVVGVFAAEPTNGTMTAITLTNGSDTATAYLYYPTVPDFAGTVMPITFVYPDKTVANEAEAMEYIDTAGILDILEDNGTFGIVFTPANGSANYSEIDVMILNAAKDKFSDYGFIHNGKVQSMFGSQYAGSRFRTFVYADGKGADFIAKYVTKRISYTLTFPDGFSMKFNYLPVSYALFNVNEKANPDEYMDSIPAFIVNGSKEVVNSFRELNGRKYPTVSTHSWKKGITPRLAQEAWKFMFPYQRTECTPGTFLITKYIADYNKAGLKYTEHVRETITEIGNNHRYTYFTYVPKHIKGKHHHTMPMVMLFHGGNNSALYIAQTSDWLRVALKNNFIVVSVQHSGVKDETGAALPITSAVEVKALRDYLVGKLKIDSSRVYATGFSMGSLMTTSLASAYPGSFAGFGPCNPAGASYAAGLITPSFGIMGLTDPLAGPGGMMNPAVTTAKAILTNNGCYVDPTVNPTDKTTWQDPIWGYAPSGTKAISAYGGNNTYTVNYYNNISDGIAYTVLCSVSNLSHETIGATAWIQWEFFKKFSRNADGSIKVAHGCK